MARRGFIAEYFHFTRKDRVGILVLLAIIAIVNLVPYFIPDSMPYQTTAEDSAWMVLMEKTQKDTQPDYSPFNKPQRRLAYKQTYEQPPGHFENRRPFQFDSTMPARPNWKANSSIDIVEINSTDTTALIALPGIGSKLANRIIRFRDQLGGFCSVDQLRETFGLPDSTFQKIRKYLKLGDREWTRIPINKVSVEVLRSHPYFRNKIAEAIIAYRNEHGAFKELADIQNIVAITEESFQKMLPYLSLE